MNSRLNVAYFLLFSLFGQFCLAQKIDSSVLKILKASFDKVENSDLLNYRMIFVDSIGSDREMRLSGIDTVFVSQKNNTEKLFVFTNGSAKLVTKDTLYSYISLPRQQVIATDNWVPHEYLKFEIQTLIGRNKDFINNKDIDSVVFVSEAGRLTPDYYVIDIFYKKEALIMVQ